MNAKPEAIAFLELRRHADAFVSADDRFAGAHVAQLATRGVVSRHHDDRVHALLVDLDPLAADADMGPVIGRGVEVVGNAAVLLRRLHERVTLADGMTAEAGQLLEQVIERGGIRDRDAHLDARRIVVGPTDVEMQDFVRSPEFDDLVEDRGEQARVDQVPFGRDGVGRRHATDCTGPRLTDWRLDRIGRRDLQVAGYGVDWPAGRISVTWR